MFNSERLLKIMQNAFDEGPPPEPFPDVAHVALHVGSSPPAISGASFVEPSAPEYVRQQISNAAFWSPAEIPITGPYEGFAIKQNVQSLTWPEAASPWGTPTFVGMFPTTQGGLPFAVAEITEGQLQIVFGVQVRFSPARLTLVARRF